MLDLSSPRKVTLSVAQLVCGVVAVALLVGLVVKGVSVPLCERPLGGLRADPDHIYLSVSMGIKDTVDWPSMIPYWNEFDMWARKSPWVHVKFDD